MKLTDEQKQFIVTQYAVFMRNWEIAHAFRDKYGIELKHQQISNYNLGRADSDDKRRGYEKWRPLFNETRAKFIADTGAMAIANAAYRIARLDQMFDHAFRTKNYRQAAALLEQAAKETGGSYTNKREIQADIEASVSDEASIPKEVKRQMLAERIRDAVATALEAGAAPVATPAVTH